MVFLIESIAVCLLFTRMLELVTKKRREAFANDDPTIAHRKSTCSGT